VISSLLNLQVEKFSNIECIRNKEVLEAFRESQNRVVSITLMKKFMKKKRGIPLIFHCTCRDLQKAFSKLTELETPILV